MKIKIKNIYLATKNPRIEDISIDVTTDYFLKNQQNDDKNNIKEILGYEGSLKDFLELVNSLSTGFDEFLDKPYVIRNGEEYIVVEGNRRIAALKLLNGMLELPKYDEIIQYADDEISIEDGANVSETQDRKNYNLILEAIDNYAKKDVEFKIPVNIIEIGEDKQLQVAIFSNHITGKTRGKRNWNRGKTLLMYLNFVGDNERSDELINKIAKLLNRTVGDVKANLNSAYFIKQLVDGAGLDSSEYFKQYKVSSLEKQFIRKFINVDGKTEMEQLITIDNDGNIKDKRMTAKDFVKFIIEAHKNKLILTRISESLKEKILSSEIYLKYINGIKPANEIEQINFSTIINQSFRSISRDNTIKKISEKAKTKDEKEIEGKTIELKENYSKLQEILKNQNKEESLFQEWFANEKLKTIKDTLEILMRQISILLDNSDAIKKIHINGLSAATRAFSETIVYLLFMDKDFIKLVLNKTNDNKLFVENLFKYNAALNKKKLSARYNKTWDVSLAKQLPNLISTNKLKSTSSIFPKVKKLYLNGDLTLNEINDELMRIYNIPKLKKEIVDKIFDDQRYSHESQAIHMPHAFYLNEEYIFNITAENIRIIYRLIDEVFLRH